MLIKKLCFSLILMLFFAKGLGAFAHELEFQKEFSMSELKYFLEVWPDYLKWEQKYQKNHKKAVFSDLGESTSEYPKEIIDWLEKKHFTVDRFFYLAERINLAIRSCLIKEEQKKVALSHQANLEKNLVSSLMAATLKQEIKKAETAHLAFGITEEELALICPNMAVIENIMLGKN